MGFWSKIGLADAESMTMLIDKLNHVTAENAELKRVLAAQDESRKNDMEMMRNKLDQTAEDADKSSAQHTDKLDSLQAELHNIKILLTEQQTEVLTEFRQQNGEMRERILEAVSNFKDITASVDAMKNSMNRNYKSLQKLASEVDDAVRSNADVLNDIGQNVEEQNTAIIRSDERIQKELKQMMSENQKQSAQFSDMEEYLRSLWEVTKLLWVNDILDEREKLD